MQNRNRAVRAACGAVIEAMEDRRLFAVAIPDGYVYVDTVIAPASNAAKNGPKTVFSQDPLESDVSYFLRAVGKYQLAHSPVVRYGDAGYYQHRDPPRAWTPSVRGTNLRVEGVEDWGALDSDDNHYGAFITGNGAKLETKILDSNYSDNDGYISLEIYAKPNLRVTELSYDAVNGNDHHDLLDDYDAEPYSGSHWLDANEDGDTDDYTIGDQRFPTAYVSGGTIKVDGKFKIEGLSSSSPTPEVLIKGTGTDGIMFDATEAAISGGYANATLIASTPFAVETVRFYESFSIDWESSTDGGLSWQSVGTTSNEISVLFSSPSSAELYYSVVAVSAKEADGAKTPEELFAGAWKPFEARSWTQRQQYERLHKDGKLPRQLTYWNSPAEIVTRPDGSTHHKNNTWQKLLQSATGDGDCEAWTGLFEEMLKAHFGEVNAAFPKMTKIAVLSAHQSDLLNNVRDPVQMLFKNYSFVANPAAPLADGWTHRDGEYTDDAGLAAQGNANPPSIWYTHMILMVEIGGTAKFYDASYGVGGFGHRSDYEIAVLAGSRATKVDQNNPNGIKMVRKNDAVGPLTNKDVSFRKYLGGPNLGEEVDP